MNGSSGTIAGGRRNRRTTGKNSAVYPDKMAFISPAHFYSNPLEKTKLNWFCFEYALELETCIKGEPGLMSRLGRKGVDELAVAMFCVHYSKHMKGQVLAKLSGSIPIVEMGYEAIEEFFPSIGDALVNRLFEPAAKAWESITKWCVVCPNRCISEKDHRATMFDDPFYWE